MTRSDRRVGETSGGGSSTAVLEAPDAASQPLTAAPGQGIQGSDVDSGHPSGVQRVWSAPFAAHLAMLLVLLIGLAAATSAGDSFATDEGSYELQLRALDHGSWVLKSGTEQLDSTDAHYPVAFAEHTADGWVPLAKHPAWPWLALVTSKVT